MEGISGYHDFEEWPMGAKNIKVASGPIEKIDTLLVDGEEWIKKESIASTPNWEAFANKVKEHVAATQREKYAKDKEVQVIDAVLGTMQSREEKLGYLLGTAKVMICRYGNKSDREGRIYDKLDLLKAAHYLAMAWVLDK